MEIYEQAHGLFVKEDFNERDLYVAMELQQRYIEILDELLMSDLQVNTKVTVQTEGQTIQFPNIEAVSSWLT